MKYRSKRSVSIMYVPLRQKEEKSFGEAEERSRKEELK